MRAVRYDGQDVFLDRSAAPRDAGPGEAVVRPILVGIDEDDLAVVRGSTGFRGVIGHQFVGTVERVGPGADESLVGARVVADPSIPDPGSARARQGLGEHDPARRVLGLRGLDGCLADRFVIPANTLYPVPGNVDDAHAVLAVPVARALHASRLLRIERKTYITIVGEGVMALLMAQVMAPLNASVRLLSDSGEHLSMAERWGVRHREAGEAGRRADQDVVVVAGGAPGIIGEALTLVRPRGTVMLVSGAHTDATIDPTPVFEHEITLLGARTGSVRQAIEAMRTGSIDLDGLIARRFVLDDAVSALRAACEASVGRCVVAA